MPDSALLVDADTLGADLAQGGAACALWLAENGYVVGTPDGQTIELHAGETIRNTGSVKYLCSVGQSRFNRYRIKEPVLGQLNSSA